MNIDELIILLRQKYPVLTKEADNDFNTFFLDKEDWAEFPSFWLQSFTKILNLKMNTLADEMLIQNFFETLEAAYFKSNEETKNYIDAYIVENLFWQIRDDYREYYWNLLPKVLQDLYLNFFRQKPFC